jgi:hypothetical protein
MATSPHGLLERIRGRTIVDSSGCWNWQGWTDKDGYGRITVRPPNKHLRTHRATYEAVHGPIPTGLTIDHLCRNRRCCNPDHLEAVTFHENVRRRPNNGLLSHCKYGHPMNGPNLRIVGRARERTCVECIRRRSREYKARKRAAVIGSAA